MAKKSHVRHTPSAYQQKLLDPRWQRRRLEILQRDNWTCWQCGDTQATLHVHHRYYLRETDPWDYPLDALVTLCAYCHEVESTERRETEAQLLKAFRIAGLSREELYYLALTFARTRFKTAEDMGDQLGAVRWALQERETMQPLVAAYQAFLERL